MMTHRLHASSEPCTVPLEIVRFDLHRRMHGCCRAARAMADKFSPRHLCATCTISSSEAYESATYDVRFPFARVSKSSRRHHHPKIDNVLIVHAARRTFSSLTCTSPFTVAQRCVPGVGRRIFRFLNGSHTPPLSSDARVFTTC